MNFRILLIDVHGSSSSHSLTAKMHTFQHTEARLQIVVLCSLELLYIQLVVACPRAMQTSLHPDGAIIYA